MSKDILYELQLREIEKLRKKLSLAIKGLGFYDKCDEDDAGEFAREILKQIEEMK